MARIPDEVIEVLEKHAESSEGGFLVLVAGGVANVLPGFAKGRVMTLYLDADDLFQQLQDLAAGMDASQREKLGDLARQGSMEGVRHRREGEWAAAVGYYRFALFVACMYSDSEGERVLLSNLWILRAALQEEIGETAKEDAGESSLLGRIRQDGQTVAAVLAQRVAGDAAQELVLALCLRRAADLADDDVLRRDAFGRLQRLAGVGADPDLLEVALEEVARATLPGVLAALGLFASPAEDNEFFHEAAEFDTAWRLYEKYRDILAKSDPSAHLWETLHVAFRHFRWLRLKTTTAGGRFGHELSYVISARLQFLARDVVMLWASLGEWATALELAEECRGRALADWMSRTRTSNRLYMDLRLRGSVNAVHPASLAEMLEGAKSADAPVLSYLMVQDSLLVWLLQPDGALVAARVPPPDAAIRSVVRALPFFSSAGELARSHRHLVPPDSMHAPAGALEQDLVELYRVLFPAEIRSALGGNGPLVVIPDSDLEFIPFCALRTLEGRYLVEDYEISFCPSFSARLLLESNRDGRRAESRGQGQSVVLGDPCFDTRFEISLAGMQITAELEPLPGTRREAEIVAELLGVTPKLGNDAVMGAMAGESHPAVVHLATHGVLNAEAPLDSFVALADGPLTAAHLYEYDPGIRATMVVLSACQTGLGGTHPDSTFGLANGFLIAGAECVVSTLWQIRDQETVRLVERFYRSLEGGASIPAALAEAQRTMLHIPETKHPLYWAAFKVVGLGANPLES